MPALTLVAKEKLQTLARDGRKRTLKESHRLEEATVKRNGRRFISFSCNDYLGLSQHPGVKAAGGIRDATVRRGRGVRRVS